MGVLVVDDSDPNVIYSGEWQTLLGSTRQWDGTVHTTIQTGASASVSFQATTVTVIVTIPPGSEQQALVDIQLDGMEPARVTMTSSAAAVYANTIWTSPILLEEVHTITLTNRGGGNDLNFSFDRLKLESTAFEPKVLAPQGPPIISTPSISTSAQPSPNPQMSTGLQNAVTSSSVGASDGAPSHSNPFTTSGTGISSMSPQTTATLPLLPTGDTNLTNTLVLPGISPVPDDASSNPHEHKSSGPAQLGSIVGGTLGALFIVCVVITLCIFKRRRRGSLDIRVPQAFVDNSGLCQCRSPGSSTTTNFASSSNGCESVSKGSTTSLLTTKAGVKAPPSKMIQHKNRCHCVSHLPHSSSSHKRTPKKVSPLCSDETFSQHCVIGRSADRVTDADVMEARDLPPAYAPVPRCQRTAA